MNRQLGTSSRVQAIDALRGIAALVVLFHHVFKLFPELFLGLRRLAPPAYDVASWISDCNKSAVLLFFVMSGYVIAKALRRSDVTTSSGLRDYSSRRAARILPLYWLSLAFSALVGLLVGMQDSSFALGVLVGNIAFLQTSADDRGLWFPPFALNGPYWSLSYEMFYYSVCPLLVICCRSLDHLERHVALFVILCICASIAAIGLNQVVANPFASFMTLSAVWCCGFAIGLPKSNHGNGTVLLALCCGTLLTIVLDWGLSQVGLKSQTLGLLESGVAGAAAFGAGLWYGSLIPGARFIGVLWNEGMVRIGSGSYALYLLHYPVLIFVRSAIAPDDAIGLGFALCLALGSFFGAYLLCPWIEARSLQLGRYLFGVQDRRRPSIS